MNNPPSHHKSTMSLFIEFLHSEKLSGVLLMLFAIIALVLANSTWATAVHTFWHQHFSINVGSFTLKLSAAHWVNDGLMAIFFLLVGLEIERELYKGELSSFKKALLPTVAAAGGMCIPALIHFAFNMGTPTQAGAGIPMATDIAFAIAVLALLGQRVPFSFKVFLVAVAIFDDLGAIFTIAVFYSGTLNITYLFSGLAIYVLLLMFNRAHVNTLWAYLLPGVLMWYCFLMSGVHATIAGVLLAFAIPFRDGGDLSPSYKLQHYLHWPVALLILPLFALANAGVQISWQTLHALYIPNALGIILGLCVGKPLGITLFTYIAVRLNWASLPQGMQFKHVAALGMVAGIGFTMSIFIAMLAFDQAQWIDQSKLCILIASFISAILGAFALLYTLPKRGISDKSIEC